MADTANGLKVRSQGNGLVVFTIDREPRRNALDSAHSAALAAEIAKADSDPDVRVMLLTGAGERAFCSGMDLKEAAEKGAGHGLVPGSGFGGITERRIRKPLIVAVNGAAVAGGFEIALAADLVIAAEHAHFALAEVKRGMFAFAGGIQRLARAVPRATGLGLILTGEPISARRAWELGLITEVVPLAQLMPRALAMGNMLCGYDADTLARAKALYEMAADAPIHESLRFGRSWGEETLASGATRSGITAYVEGRDAHLERPP